MYNYEADISIKESLLNLCEMTYIFTVLRVHIRGRGPCSGGSVITLSNSRILVGLPVNSTCVCIISALKHTLRFTIIHYFIN